MTAEFARQASGQSTQLGQQTGQMLGKNLGGIDVNDINLDFGNVRDVGGVDLQMLKNFSKFKCCKLIDEKLLKTNVNSL